jgi:hypothetical protein
MWSSTGGDGANLYLDRILNCFEKLCVKIKARKIIGVIVEKRSIGGC